MSHTDQLNRPESQEANPYIYDLVCTRVPNQFSGGIHNPLSACGKGVSIHKRMKLILHCTTPKINFKFDIH